ncbi:hypothetical protein PFISCL1PPCAC_22394, partial [Pristionchus fissidentatus]
TSSAFSMRSLIKPFTSALNSSSSESTDAATSPFDVSTCGHGKGCFLPDDCTIGATDESACKLAYSFRLIDDNTVEMELYGTIVNEVTDTYFWIAVAFSDDDKMGDEPVTECSRMTNEAAPSVKASYNFYDDEENKKDANNRRIDGEENTRASMFSTSTITSVDGVIYCKFTQKIGGMGQMSKGFLMTDAKTPFYFLVAKGTTNSTATIIYNNNSNNYNNNNKSFQTGSASSFSLLIIVMATVARMIF